MDAPEQLFKQQLGSTNDREHFNHVGEAVQLVAGLSGLHDPPEEAVSKVNADSSLRTLAAQKQVKKKPANKSSKKEPRARM